MYRTLLVGVWLSSGRSNVKVPHLAWCEYGVRSHSKRNVPHVARNVWLSEITDIITFSIYYCIPFPLSHTLLFMLMTKQKPKFF